MTDESSTLLDASRVYLSGPMDFVGSRIIEKYMGWRSILTPIMHALGVSVLDPWNKPEIKGLDPENQYGKEGVHRPKDAYAKDFWTNPETRAQYGEDFWEIVHIDLRMVDISDFMISFVPTNIYSVGTVHEIITARQQQKATLMVSPPITYDHFPELSKLSDSERAQLKNYGLSENPDGLPSQWYAQIVSGHYFFDGFGWENISLQSDTFYEELFEAVLEQGKNNKETDHFDHVKAWVENYQPLKELTGSVLDNVVFENDEEKEQFRGAYHDMTDKKYFWYDKPYTPKRSVLYYLLSIASGIIPPKITLNASLDENGNIVHKPVRVKDDAWLLTSIAEKSDYRKRRFNSE